MYLFSRGKTAHVPTGFLCALRKSTLSYLALNSLAKPRCIEKSPDTAWPSEIWWGQLNRSPLCSTNILPARCTFVLGLHECFLICKVFQIVQSFSSAYELQIVRWLKYKVLCVATTIEAVGKSALIWITSEASPLYQHGDGSDDSDDTTIIWAWWWFRWFLTLTVPSPVC